MDQQNSENAAERVEGEPPVEGTAATAVNEEQIVQPENPLPSVIIDDLPPHWQKAIARAGWSELMPVQSLAMPYMMAGRHMMVQARTGSGKTGAFVLPIMELVNPLQDTCQALILTPTRELAKQVARDAETLTEGTGMRVVTVYGGVSYGPQLDGLRKGAHLVVGTPGRILDHLLRRSLSLEQLKVMVFDEADRMLSFGFYPDMKQIQNYLPKRRINMQMFSATFPPRVLRVAREFLEDPGFLSLSRDSVHVADVSHSYYLTPHMDKDRGLVRIIEKENPDSAIIFCNTKQRVHYVAVVLRRFGYDADELSGDLSQQARERVLGRIRAGDLRFLVATDVAARGIDIPELSHVIQYEPPEDVELYIHRAGRTGRAGASGEAMTLVDFMELPQLKRIAGRYGIDLQERPLPSDEDVAKIVTERVTVLLENQLRDRDRLRTERMRRFMPLVKELGESEEGRTLLAMLVDDYYQDKLHDPPPVPPPQQSTDNKGKRGKGRRRGKRR